jgi:LysM repeat protein
MPAFRPDRIGGQGGLVALMGLAFAAILLARLTAGGPALSPTDLAGGTDPSATPRVTQDAGAEPGTTPGLTPDGAPTRTLVPTQGEPTPPPAATPGTDPTTGPAATPGRPSTYTIKSGDTLSGVAGEFGTTWQVLADLNGIDDPGRLRVGQVIDLP